MKKVLLLLIISCSACCCSFAQDDAKLSEIETLLNSTNSIVSVYYESVGSVKDKNNEVVKVSKATVKDEIKGTQLNGVRIDYSTKKSPSIMKHKLLDKKEVNQMIEFIPLMISKGQIKGNNETFYKTKSGLTIGSYSSGGDQVFYLKMGEDEFRLPLNELNTFKGILIQAIK
jgi:hypothetical protein